MLNHIEKKNKLAKKKRHVVLPLSTLENIHSQCPLVKEQIRF